MALLVTPPTSQYAQQGQVFSYQFPAWQATGGGDITYLAWINRPGYGISLPSWLTFTSATRTFSGTPTVFEEIETLQIVIECREVGQTTKFAYFPLRVGPSDSVGRPVFKNNDTPNHTLNISNLDTFDTNTVSTGQWVLIDSNLYPLNATAVTKITACRTNGGWLVWKTNNQNRLLLFTSSVRPSIKETVGLDFSAGTIGSIHTEGMANGVRGGEIHFTNLTVIGFIETTAANDQPVLHKRVGSNVDSHLVWFGQPYSATPQDFVPFTDVFGVGLRSTSSTLCRATSGFQQGLEFGFVELGAGTAIGFHIKSDLTATQGDRRPAQNASGIDYNMKYIVKHHCYVHDVEGEGVYDGGGFWAGRNNDGNRFYHYIEYVRTWHCIFRKTGWDAIQEKNVIRGGSVRYNDIDETGVLPGASNAQRFGIFIEAFVGDISWNWIKRAGRTGMRCYDFGLTLVHNNVVIIQGTEGIYGAKLPVQSDAPNQSPGPLLVNKDIPTLLGYSPGSNPRSEVLDNELYCLFFHNTIIGGTDSIRLFSDTPGGQIRVQNNLIINTTKTTLSLPAGSIQSGNVILTGQVLADIFVDPTIDDYRILGGSVADATGVDISAYFSETKDYGGKTRNLSTPGVGAFEAGSFVNLDRYNFVVNSGTANIPPTVNAGPDLNIQLPTTSTSITASASDTDGTIASYQWSQISGPNIAILATSTTATVGVSGLIAGTYVLRITVIDNGGASASDDVTITVQAASQTLFQWYSSPNANMIPRTPILGANSLDYTPPTGQNLYFAIGITPKAKTGTRDGAEKISSSTLIA